MLFYQVKDYVREHFGRAGIPTSFLDLALEAGRLEVENAGNFWWMQSQIDFNTVDGTQTYIIGSGAAINIARFKDAKFLFWKETTDVQWEIVDLGQWEKDELDRMYNTDDAGTPEAAALVNKTLYLYPPDPDAVLNMRLYYYQYTSNPAQTSSDDLTTDFPMGLVYASLAQGYELELKDMQAASYWRGLLEREIKKIKKVHLKRGWKDMIQFIPFKGPGRGRRRLDNVQIYGDRWT